MFIVHRCCELYARLRRVVEWRAKLGEISQRQRQRKRELEELEWPSTKTLSRITETAVAATPFFYSTLTFKQLGVEHCQSSGILVYISKTF